MDVISGPNFNNHFECGWGGYPPERISLFKQIRRCFFFPISDILGLFVLLPVWDVNVQRIPVKVQEDKNSYDHMENFSTGLFLPSTCVDIVTVNYCDKPKWNKDFMLLNTITYFTRFAKFWKFGETISNGTYDEIVTL